MKNGQIILDDLNTFVLVKGSVKAKRLIMRLNIVKRCFVLTVPKRTSEKRIFEFLYQNKDWISKKLLSLHKLKTFYDGMKIGFFSNDFVICHMPDAKRGVWIEGDEIKVSGSIEELGIRVERFLKKEAKKIFKAKAESFASKINIKIGEVKIKDTSSRWGSCSIRNNVNFNWRLAFAPLFVSEYVIVHEVVHLLIKNHGKEFWNEVKKHCVDYKLAENWLKKNGNELFCYRGKS